MQIVEDIETHVEYFWKRSNGWDWFGCPRWWEVTIEFMGFNGVGGVWIIERWRWNNSYHIITEQPKTLNREDSEKLINEILGNRYIDDGKLPVFERNHQ